MSFVGILQVGIELGLDAILIKPRRGIGDMPIAQATLEEVHNDELEITDQPVEFGAMITDHAFKRPAECIITVGYSNSPGSSALIGSLVGAVTGTLGGIASLLTGNSVNQVRDVYQKFLELQESRVPFDVYTGKRIYKDMLVKGLKTVTNKELENAMVLVVHLRQIIIVPTATNLAVSADAEDQAQPEDTNPDDDGGVQQLEDAPAYNESAGNASLVDDPETGQEVLA